MSEPPSAIRRWIQALSVASFLVTPVASIGLTAFLYHSPITRNLYRLHLGKVVLALYLLWIYTVDRNAHTNGGRPLNWLRTLCLWRHFREYFPSRLIGSRAALNPSQPYVVAIHPHGVWSVGVFANFVFENQALPGVDYRVATISNNFRVPFWRDLLLGLGFVSADRQTFEHLLGDRKSICVVVGGAKEALDSRPGTNDLTLSTRLGFVRLAMQNGAHLIPVYTFGETDVYAQVLPNPPGSLVRWVQEKLLDWFGYSVPVILGSFGVLPRRRPITTVVGDPVVVPHIRDPTTEQVALAHDAYVKALQKLFDEHADYYAPNRKSDLRLVDTPIVKPAPAPVSAKSRL